MPMTTDPVSLPTIRTNEKSRIVHFPFFCEPIDKVFNETIRFVNLLQVFIIEHPSTMTGLIRRNHLHDKQVWILFLHDFLCLFHNSRIYLVIMHNGRKGINVASHRINQMSTSEESPFFSNLPQRIKNTFYLDS